MAQGSYGSYLIPPTDFKVIRDLVVAALEAEKYAIRRRKSTARDVKVVGIYGSKVIATLVTSVPLLKVFGFGTRVQATVICRKSLTERESEYRLTIKVEPIKEETDEVEGKWGPSQDALEQIGDHRQARRCFEHLVSTFRAEGILRG